MELPGFAAPAVAESIGNYWPGSLKGAPDLRCQVWGLAVLKKACSWGGKNVLGGGSPYLNPMEEKGGPERT